MTRRKDPIAVCAEAMQTKYENAQTAGKAVTGGEYFDLMAIARAAYDAGSSVTDEPWKSAYTKAQEANQAIRNAWAAAGYCLRPDLKQTVGVAVIIG